MMEEIYKKLVSTFKVILNEQNDFTVEELRKDDFLTEFTLYPPISERIKTVFESAEAGKLRMQIRCFNMKFHIQHIKGNRIADNKPYNFIALFVKTYEGFIHDECQGIYSYKKKKSGYRHYIYEDGSIWTTVNNKRWETRVKDIEYPLLLPILSTFYPDNLYLKDFYRKVFLGKLNVDIKLSDLKNYHTKKVLFSNRYKIELPKRINRFEMKTAAEIAQACLYVDPKQWVKIFDYAEKNNSDCFSVILENIIAQNIIAPNIIDTHVDIDISDYVRTCIKIKSKVDLNIKSYNSFRRKKEIADDIFRLKYTPAIHIPQNTELSKLKLPKDFEIIRSKKRLVQEGSMQHNCVALYAEKINKGKCIICSCVFNGNRYTIEISLRKRKDKNKFIVQQCRRQYNASADEEFITYLNNVLEKASLKQLS